MMLKYICQDIKNNTAEILILQHKLELFSQLGISLRSMRIATSFIREFCGWIDRVTLLAN